MPAPHVRFKNDWLPFVAGGALLAAMVWLARDFGSTWDERALQKYGEQIWDFYTGRIPRSGIDLSFGYVRIYGALVEVVSLAAQHVIHSDIWIVRHQVNAVFGWLGVVAAFMIGDRLLGRRAAWLAALLLVAMPRYVGESMNNPKDLPFAVLMLAATYYIVTIRTEYPYFSWPHALKLGVVIALALNVRGSGMLALVYAGAALAIVVASSGDWTLRHLGGAALRFAAVAGVALIGASAFWPWAQERPIVAPLEAFFLASSFNWGNPSLFNGHTVGGSGEVPWYYLPTWLGVTVPLVVFAGAAGSGVFFRRLGASRWRLAALWGLFLFPAVAAMARHVSLYDGIRHMFFIVPLLAVIAAAGWNVLLSLPRARARTMAAVALVALAAEPIVFEIRNHPNENVYFSPLAGGPRAAFGRFDMDYWGNCVLEATDWSAAQSTRAGVPLGVAANAWEVLTMDIHRYRSLYFRQQREGGFHLFIVLLKGTSEGVVNAANDPSVLHRVETADGTPLCLVLPGPEYGQLQARLAQQTAGPNR